MEKAASKQGTRSTIAGKDLNTKQDIQHQAFQDTVKGSLANPNPCADGPLCNAALAEAKGGRCVKPAKTKIPPQYTAKNARRNFASKKNAFRFTMPKDIANEKIIYQIEKPLRAAVKMQYLMNSTKVKLNDSDFMDVIYGKLIKGEKRDLEKITEVREKTERDRVKLLVLDGQMAAPPDMEYLNDHPVFRVTKMLQQLDDHSRSMLQGPKPTSKITPVEPYEFDGDKFFKNLHQNGTYWVPSEELLAEQEKLAGKIARAKLRLRQQKAKDAEQEKLIKMINTKTTILHGEDSDSDTDIGYVKGRLSNIFDTLQVERAEQNEIFNRRKIKLKKQEAIRKAKVLARQRIRDKVYLEAREMEEKYFRDIHYQRQRDRTLDEKDLEKAAIFRNENNDTVFEVDASEMFKAEQTPRFFPPVQTPPDVEETDSFWRLRAYFNIRGSNKFAEYGPYNNPLIERYLDATEKADAILNGGYDLSEMYSREAEHCDTFMKKLNRDFNM